jgi:hypothetical protein
MPTIDGDGNFVLRYELLHVSGQSRVGCYPLPATTSKAQELGSAITYGRRYCLSSVIGIAPDDDDDGAAAQSAPPQRRAPKLDVDSVRAALDAAESMQDLRVLWPDARAAGLQAYWKVAGAKFKKQGEDATTLWSQIMQTVPEDWATSRVEEEFAAFTGVSAEEAGVEHMTAYLEHVR